MAQGRKTGGRQRGSLNKRTLELQALAAGVVAAETPLAFMSQVYQNAGLDLSLRLDAAKSAAPFLHPRLTAVTLKGDEEEPVHIVTRIEIVGVEPKRE